MRIMGHVEHYPHGVTLDSDAVVVQLRTMATADELESESLTDWLLTLATLHERVVSYRDEVSEWFRGPKSPADAARIRAANRRLDQVADRLGNIRRRAS